jgi:hypothetical protein
MVTYIYGAQLYLWQRETIDNSVCNSSTAVTAAAAATAAAAVTVATAATAAVVAAAAAIVAQQPQQTLYVYTCTQQYTTTMHKL